MRRLRLLPFSAPFISIGVLFAFLSQPGHKTRVMSQFADSSTAYIQRGRRAEQYFQAYSKLLAGYYESLVHVTQESAPDLLAHFQAPEPPAYGYQILPRITFDAVPDDQPAARAVAYSWPWTERLIDGEQRKIFRAMAELRRAAATGTMRSSRTILQKLVLDYQKMRERHGNIDAHVRYNRFWQAAIATDRPAYDRATLLQNDVLERQNLLAASQNRSPALKTSSVSSQAPDATPRPLGIAAGLNRDEALLAHRINAVVHRIDTPSFIRLEHSNDEWVFRIPVFTDIDDQDFVAAAKRIIESTWRIKQPEKSFRVELDVSYVSTGLLYAKQIAPARGAPLDLRRHLGRFPSGGAILTTGALTTHVQDYAIVLGPRAITPRVLAHEFGHILGFRDGYVRGYKNLGVNGFQIMEVVAFPGDIMAAPSTGRVLPSHFEKLIERATGDFRQGPNTQETATSQRQPSGHSLARQNCRRTPIVCNTQPGSAMPAQIV